MLELQEERHIRRILLRKLRREDGWMVGRMGEMLIYDQHICPVAFGGYCPYGYGSERCASCEDLKSMEESYGLDEKDGEQND